MFGFGTYEPLEPSNPRIFAHIRSFEDDLMLCVHNLARSAQAVELDLSAYEGRYPVELFGRSRFPRIGELPYLLTLAPRGFYWFQLVEEDEWRPVTDAVTGIAGGDLSLLDEEALSDWVAAPALVRVQVARGRRRSSSIESVALRDEPPLLVLA